jgi:hypothetical protein
MRRQAFGGELLQGAAAAQLTRQKGFRWIFALRRTTHLLFYCPCYFFFTVLAICSLSLLSTDPGAQV